ncbi:MAG: CvpA family protein [Gammaproteobacteria bacterium]|nr:CvpA family protein [Gammaproteobacteria bacterium]
MVWVDLVIVGIVLVSALISLFRGFVKESISLATWILAGVIAVRYMDVMANLLEGSIESVTIRMAAAFAVLFIVTLIVGAIINFVVSQMVNKTGLGGTDKVLGMVFGFARGILIVVMIVLLAGLTPMPEEPWWQESLLIEHISSISVWIREFLPQDLAEKFAL